MKKTLLLFLFSAVSFRASGAPLEEKIAQMLIVGFRGSEVSNSPEIVRDILKFKIGGVILFDRDIRLKASRNIIEPTQVRTLVEELQALSATPLLISVDQEGGAVARLKDVYGFHPSARAQDLGAVDDLACTADLSRTLVQDLVGVGINLNFAPVVDLNLAPMGAIGKDGRSYSANPRAVERHAARFIQEHRQSGVLTTLKHFPGHGSSIADSHLGFVDVSATWSPLELEPYATLLKAGMVDAIMTAHVFHRGFDPDYPATLSKKILSGLLRKRFSYDGVLISDDMTMKAIRDHFGATDALRLAINAGVDMLIFGNNLEYDPDVSERTIQSILKLIRDGEISLSRIEEAYQRIQRLKHRIPSR